MKNIQQQPEAFQSKKVIVRCNFDVPIEEGKVQDTTRIEDAIPTIKFLRQQNASLILLAHYDRPEGKPSAEKSLEPVTSILQDLLSEPVTFIGHQPQPSDLIFPPDNPIVLVENLRFWSGEEDNDPDFARAVASWGEVYVNEAFANCHRQHASIVGIPQHLPSFVGLALNREIQVLNQVRHDPKKPLVIIIGGAKLETKEPLIEVFADKADQILVGGKSAVDLHGREGLPPNVHIADLTPDKKDITEAAANQFAEYIQKAQTVIWNGTMGVYEEPGSQLGTKIVAKAVTTTPAFTLIGGGDTEAALTEFKLESGIDHISTGGGAMLTFLSEGKLVGIDAISQ